MIIWVRRGIIMTSATALLLNILYIRASRHRYIIEKNYQHFEVKLFILMEIFYIVSLLSVVFHNTSFDYGHKYVTKDYD